LDGLLKFIIADVMFINEMAKIIFIDMVYWKLFQFFYVAL
jgi:hypothetical protein